MTHKTRGAEYAECTEHTAENTEHTEQTPQEADDTELGSSQQAAVIDRCDPTILFSSVADDARYGDVDNLEDIARHHNAQIISTDVWDLKQSATTHLVTSHGKVQGHSKRTVKYFSAILKGNWIVSVDWCAMNAAAYAPASSHSFRSQCVPEISRLRGRWCI